MIHNRIFIPFLIILALFAMSAVITGIKSNNERDQYRSSSDLAECSVTISAESGSASLTGLEPAGFEDLRNPIGVMDNDTLRIILEARARRIHKGYLPVIY